MSIGSEGRGAETVDFDASMRESAEAFRTLVDSTPVMVWISGPDKLCTFFNVPWLNFTGRTMEQELGFGWAESVNPDDLARCLQVYNTAFDARRDFTMEYRLRRADGVYRWILDKGVPLQAPGAGFTGYIGSCIDITDRKEMEEALRRNEERYRAFFDLNAVGASETRLPDGRFIRVNDALCRMTGYTRDELLSLRFSDLSPPEERQRSLELFGRLGRGELQSYGLDKRYVRKDGDTIWVHLEVSAGHDSGGHATYAIGIVQDISDRKRAEEAQRLSADRYRFFFELNALGAAEVNLSDGRYVLTNDAYCRMLGYSREELLEMRFVDITHPDDRDEDVRQFARLVRGEVPSYRLEKRYIRKDGSIMWGQLAATLIRNGDGTPISRLGLVLDITERKHAEQELQWLAARLLQSQDEERRRIAQELHDQTAQTVFAINLNLVQLLDTHPPLDNQSMSIVAESLGLGQHLLQEIRTLSYLLHPPLLDQVGLASALEWYVDGFGKRSGIEVELVTLPDLGRLPSEVETALFRIVQESLTNIHRHSGSKHASIRVAKDSARVVLEIRDQGSGLEAESGMSSDDARSLGVGIAGMRQRVAQLGGDLSIKSAPGGTVVSATVPVDGGSGR